ncbi:glycoside hydrolase family 43 protein [Sorangium atrum]|uniref:Glycoside hydrolase family 43 protein n=1 Tax=Sorangium atrum TaxID=2995308 RepID=A0ABT5BUC7_9BACT|nr:glycoside hydrolase family 43 protein [Sorangium aterium]MDC0677761.1 glycoside hydrolase family 43 protein [Sorangium aterium]
MTLSAMALATAAAIASPARADNPIVQTSYTADPAPMVHEGRLYLYTSHDEDVSVNNFYTMNDWHLYSTTDMVNWTDHGTPAGYKSFSWGTGDAWAVQGVARNGKFYLYVPLNNATGAKIGVGVSDNVAGPFMDPLGKALAQKDSGNIDPTVFVDDDGQAYMYWGNGTLRYVKLNSDMITTSGNITNVALNGFTEGPWFYKRGSLYYMVYAAIAGSEKISYATSNSPTGPWNIRGDVMDAGRTFTNHPGVVDYKGHSYFFYHNSALPGGGDFKRSVCVEEFKYGADGSIPKLTMSTNGPPAIATLDPFKQVEAETIAFSSGLKTEVCTDTGAGMNVTSISNGDYIKVKDVDFLDGVTSFEARVSSAAGNAKIELHLDSQNGTLLGTCDVSGAASWTTKTCAVSGGSGKHDLFLKFVGGGGDLFKFNWWRFTGPTMPGDGGDGGGGGGGGGSDPGAGGSGGSDGAGGATSGTGGSAVAGGTTSGSGGSVTGGTSGTTGTAGSGSSGSAGSSGGNDADGDDSDGSCACRTGASTGNGGSAVALWLVASALVLGRRRR